jgi:hypothetical protein
VSEVVEGSAGEDEVNEVEKGGGSISPQSQSHVSAQGGAQDWQYDEQQESDGALADSERNNRCVLIDCLLINLFYLWICCCIRVVEIF